MKNTISVKVEEIIKVLDPEFLKCWKCQNWYKRPEKTFMCEKCIDRMIDNLLKDVGWVNDAPYKIENKQTELDYQSTES